MALTDLLPEIYYPTRLEKLADGWVHGIALGVFTGGVAALLGLAIWQGGFDMAGAVAIYAVCLIAMIACSMAYNMAENHKRRNLLRRLDHAAIFLMIAGTYTPFTLLRFEGAWSLWMTVAVWTLALIGAAGKLFLPGIAKKFWIPLYVALGWMVLAAVGPLTHDVPLAGVILLGIGGGVYTLGVAIYVWERLPFRRAIWHGFVMAAAGVHYAAVLTGVVFA